MSMIGERANNARVRLPSPHGGQQIVRQQARRFNWLAAGRRWRKTTLMMAITAEGSVGEKSVTVWGAPTFDQVRIGYEEMRSAAAGVADFNMSRMTCTWPNGSKIFYRSMDNANNVRGYTADRVIMDEAGFIKVDVWQSVLRPMLIDTGGELWAGGTPFGRNWFWQEWHNAQDHESSMSWQAPTLGVDITDKGLVRKPHPLENPDVSFEEIKHLYETTPERLFQQEILAEFIDEAGGVFRRVREAAILEPLDAPKPRGQYVAGVDVAALVDYTVVSVMDAKTKEMVYMDRFNRVEYPVLEQRLAALYERFDMRAMVVEANSIGQPVIDHLRGRGLTVQPFTTTNATKTAVIQNLQAAFEHSSIRILDDPVLVGELLAYEGEQMAGYWKYGAPDGMHDDCVMALALAWSAVSATPPKLPEQPTQESRWKTFDGTNNGGGWKRY